MFSNRVFLFTFLVSLTAHTVFLFQPSNFTLFNHARKQPDNEVEVRYLKSPEETKAPLKIVSRKIDPFFKLPSKITASETALPPAANKEDIFKRNKANISPTHNFTKPAFIKPDVIAIKKKITLSPTEMDKINSPSYVAHSQIVREKIKRALYQNYNRMDVGEVYVSFILFHDGYLRDIRLMDEKSSSNSYLREIALRSVRDASPFPGFPKELDYDQLSFNVVISFEVE